LADPHICIPRRERAPLVVSEFATLSQLDGPWRVQPTTMIAQNRWILALAGNTSVAEQPPPRTRDC
jgi:hypothetical protein